MIVAACRSEWIKLRRPTLLYGTFLGLAAAASLFSVLVFTQARHGSGGDLPSLEELAQPNGLIHGVSRAIVLLGIVAFGIAAAQIASEYSLGTLRQLLVRQPRRAVLLIGKYLSTLMFLLGALLFASVIGFAVSVAMARTRGVDTSAWFSATGIRDLAQALGFLCLAVVGFATLGMIVGLVLRSSVAAVIVGFAYLLPVENIVVVILKGTDRWLPGELLSAIGQGGTASVTAVVALVTISIYLAIAGTIAFLYFIRSDVTA